MTTLRRSVLALLLAAPVAAQDGATTLLANAQRADAVVRATVLAATDPSPEWHRLAFRTDEVLAGAVGTSFELLEPAGACCGRTLFALAPGQSVLLFLQRTGAVLHPLGGARGVLPDDPAVVAAVRDLLAAGSDQARAHRLVQQLAHPDPRVASDAAHALGALPAVTLGGEDRAAVTAALQGAIARRSTALAPLLDTLLRQHDDAVLDELLPDYLAAPRADVAAMMRRAFARAEPARIAGRLQRFVGDDRSRQLRAAELLAELPAFEAGPGLRALVRSPCPRVQLCASRALLANGQRRAELEPFVPAPVLELAERQRVDPRRFRSITPRTP